MDLDPKCIFVQRERNLNVHHPVIKLVASLARNRGVTFTEIHSQRKENIVVAEQQVVQQVQAKKTWTLLD